MMIDTLCVQNNMCNTITENKTKGLCPFCLSWVDGLLVYKQNEGIYLQKHCPRHGISEILLSRHMQYFLELRDFYLKTHREIFPQNRYLIFLTPQCNLSCPICFLDPHAHEEREIENEDIPLIFEKRKKELILFGAEPTCREDLFEIIKNLKNKQHSVSLYSNGLRFSDKRYIGGLKKCRVDKIYLQFDGFNDSVYKTMRGRELLQEKIEALHNLKELSIPVVLDVAIAKEVNEDQIGKIFDYSLEHKFIKAINFVAYVRSGCGRDYLNEGYLMPDEIVDCLVKHTEGKVSRKNIYIFQKLLYAYMSILRRRTCFYIQYFWVYRMKNKEYMPFDKIIDFTVLDRMLDNYASIKIKKGDFLSLIYLILNMPRCIIAIRNFRIFLKWLGMSLTHIFRIGEYAQINSNFLQLIFSTACDANKSDLKIIQHCHVGIIYKDNSGKVCTKDENGLYLLSKEVKTKAKSK